MALRYEINEFTKEGAALRRILRSLVKFVAGERFHGAGESRGQDDGAVSDPARKVYRIGSELSSTQRGHHGRKGRASESSSLRLLLGLVNFADGTHSSFAVLALLSALDLAIAKSPQIALIGAPGDRQGDMHCRDLVAALAGAPRGRHWSERGEIDSQRVSSSFLIVWARSPRSPARRT
jgi:hypothetical protein